MYASLGCGALSAKCTAEDIAMSFDIFVSLAVALDSTERMPLFYLQLSVFLLMVRLVYLQWGNCQQKRPNPISGRGGAAAKKTEPNFRMGGTVSKKDQTEFPP